MQLMHESAERLEDVCYPAWIAGVMERSQRLVQQFLSARYLTGLACELRLRLERGPDRKGVLALACDERRFFDRGHGRCRLSARHLGGCRDQQRADAACSVVVGPCRRQRLTHQRRRTLELAGGVLQQAQVPHHQWCGVVPHLPAQRDRLLDMRSRGCPLSGAELAETEEREVEHREQRVAEQA